MSHKPKPIELLNYSLREIPQMVEHMSEKEQRDVVLDLYAVAYNAAFIAEYTRYRFQQLMPHAEAMAVANRARARVRRTLGLQPLPKLNF